MGQGFSREDACAGLNIGIKPEGDPDAAQVHMVATLRAELDALKAELSSQRPEGEAESEAAQLKAELAKAKAELVLAREAGPDATAVTSNGGWDSGTGGPSTSSDKGVPKALQDALPKVLQDALWKQEALPKVLQRFMKARAKGDAEGAAACCNEALLFKSPLGQVQELDVIQQKVFTKALDPEKPEPMRWKEGTTYHNHWVHQEGIMKTSLTQEVTLTSNGSDARVCEINIFVRKSAVTKFLIRSGCAPA